jgi:hypothetical protein
MSTNEFGSDAPGAPALTPSKQRYDLGAASSYYFKYVNSSSKKSTSKKDQSFASAINDVDNDDTADSSAMVGLDSILGLSSDGDSHDGGGRDKSMTSLGANSQSSGGSSDDNNLMNKSTLSDTTELSAANFVLTATSRQRLNLIHLAGVAKNSRQNHETANVNNGSFNHSKENLAQHLPSSDKENAINLSYELQNNEQQFSKRSPHEGLHRKDSRSHMGSPAASRSMLPTQKSHSPSIRKPNDTLTSSGSKSPMKRSGEPWSAKRFSQDSSKKGRSSPLVGVSPSLAIESNEKESRDSRRTSLASTGSGGGPSPHSTTTNDDSIASLGDFDDLFRDIIDDTVDTHSHRRQSRRQSSLQARKSSVDRLMNFDTDLSNAIPGSPSLKAPKKYSSIVRGATSSSNRDHARGATSLMDEIPSPPSTPRFKSPSLFRLRPSSHQKPTPTKIQPTPQRVQNSEAFAGSASRSSSPFAKGNSKENYEELSPGIASHLDEIFSVYLQNVSDKTNSPHTPEPVVEAKSLHAHSGTPQEDEMDEVSSRHQSISHPSIRLTPNSHKKPTPTKLTKSPRRITNPNALDSPARNTRRARNSICPMASLEDETGTSIFSPISRGGADSASPNSSPSFAQKSTSAHLPPALGVSVKDGDEVSPVQHLSPRQSDKNTHPHQEYRSTPDKPENSLQSPGTTENYTETGLSELLGVSRGQEETFEQGTETTPTKRDIYSIQIRLTPNSHVKPTPTKLKPSPRRIPNPRALALRSSRFSGKASQRQSSGDTASVGVLEELLVEGSASKRKRIDDTASAVTHHDPFELKGSFENQGASLQKRRKSSVGKFGSGKADRIENRLHESPAAKMKGPPVSILSSRKRRSQESVGPKVSQRLVAFGSPEAAEYHVGSPSFSLTPMPRGKARAMFAVPRDKLHTIELPRRLDSLNASKNGETVEIEADLNALVNNMQGSANLSPIAKVTEREATETFDMAGSGSKFSQSNSGESNIGDRARDVSGQNVANGDEALQLEEEIDNVITHSARFPEIDRDSNRGSRDSQKTENHAASPSFGSQQTKSEMEFCSPSLHEESRDAFDSPKSNIYGRFHENLLNIHEGEMTVELEPNVNALLQATQLGNSVVAPLHIPMDCTNESCSPAESIDLTDALSIASMSMNSRTEEAPTGVSPPIGAQKLDFRLHPSDRSDESMDVEFTVELENDMTSLIAVTRAAKAGASNMREPPQTQMSISSTTDDENDFDNSSCTSPDNKTSPHESSPELQHEDAATSKRLGISTRSLSDSNIGSLMRSPVSTTQASLKSPMEETSKQNSSLASTMSSHSRSVNNRTISTVEAKMRSVEMVTLNSNEILDAAGVGDVYPRMPLEMEVLDPLLQISNSARKINNVVLLASLNQFVTAVCGEVESQTEADADVALYLASAVNKDPSHLIALQRSLRSSQDGETRQEFIKLADAVKEYVESDWNSWFSNVLGSLQKTVDSSSKSLNVDFGSFDSISASHSETDKYLARLTEKSIRSLRCKAMVRQKVSS